MTSSTPNKHNVFAQEHETWKISCDAPFKDMNSISEILSENSLATTIFEKIPSSDPEINPNSIWTFEALYDHQPQLQNLASALPLELITFPRLNQTNGFKDEVNFSLYKIGEFTEIRKIRLDHLKMGNGIRLEKLQDLDWVTKVQESYQPFSVADFFIHTSYHNASIPQDSIPILLDPGRAFGTGEHATTSLCLEFISELQAPIGNILDLGTGSAILAIACAKKFPGTRIFASDIDQVSIEVAANNIKQNNVADAISLFVLEGVLPPISEHKYSLILANILCNPLIEMAPDIAKILDPKGVLIISGFNCVQVAELIECYQNLNLELLATKIKDDWVSLAFSNVISHF